MGNCMQRCVEKRQEEEIQDQLEGRTKEFVKGSDNNFVKGGNSSGGIKVKIVLTKEELEWLMIQLKDNQGQGQGQGQGKRSLEDVLAEIGRGRSGKVIETDSSWKPSLESIMEGPELLEMDR